MDVRKFIFDNQDYFEDFISRSTYHTNAIEGNTLSYAETYAILFNDNDFKVSATPREIYEAINHKYAINHKEQKRIEALTGQRKESVVERLNKYRDRVQDNRQGDSEIRDKKLNETRGSER